MARSDYVSKIIDWIGSDRLKLVDAGSGWPSVVNWDRDGEHVPLALHISQAGDYHRQPHEWRFQNPAGGEAVDDSSGLPLLVGFDESGGTPVLILADGRPRVGRETRFSILFNKSIIPEARKQGISKYVSTVPETMYACRPKMLFTAIELLVSSEELSSKELRETVQASGFVDENSNEAAERTRKAAQILFRDHKFGRSVRNAYGNECAMCGIGLGLIAGAHIHPVSAANSPDIVENGVSLCGNHHAAYDNFDIWFEPDSFEIVFSPRFHEGAKSSPVIAAFINQTFGVLRLPKQATERPAAKWIAARKDFFAENYRWLQALKPH
ncbi:MAG: HNH endonuclease [Pseudomonadota bacterium]